MEASWKPIEVDNPEALALQLCDADRIEVEAATGSHWQEALKASLIMSDYRYGGYIDDKLVAVFGLTITKQTGVPWLLTDGSTKKCPKQFLKISKQVMAEFEARKLPLINYVWKDHKESIKWLEWLGFTIKRDTLIPSNNPTVSFYIFHKGVSDV